MVSYAKYSLVPTEEPDKAGSASEPAKKLNVDKENAGGGLLNNIFNPTHKPPSNNKSTLPPPPNSAFDYTSAFNFKSAFEYNSASPSQYQSAFDYGYTRKDTAGLSTAATTKKDKGLRNSFSVSFDATKCLSVIVTGLSFVFICLTFPCTLPFCFKRLEQWERIVVFRLGRLRGVFGPGLVFIIPWSDRTNRVDMRTKAFSVPPQQVITCDNGIVEVGCEVKYRVSDVQRLTTSVTTPEHGLRNFGKTVLLNVLTKHTIKEMERDKSALASQVQKDLNSRVLEWGIEIGQVDMSQITVLKEPEPNDPLKPLLGALGSFGGGGASAPSASQSSASFPSGGLVGPGGALGSVGAGGGDFAGAANLLSGLLSGAKPVPSQKGGPTLVNIPELSGTTGSGTFSLFGGKSKEKAGGCSGMDSSSDTTPLLGSYQDCSPGGCGVPQSPLGQYLHSLVSAANSADLTHGVYRLAVEGMPQGDSAVFIIFIGAGVRQVVEGDFPSITPDVSITVSQDDLKAIFSGSLPPLQAYLSGRLTVHGSVQMLVGLQALQEVHQNLTHKDGSFVV